jgi:hypothetical protein
MANNPQETMEVSVSLQNSSSRNLMLEKWR